MELESTGYKEKCNTCLSIWKYSSDYCPECGSHDIHEFHINECECEECKTLNHVVKIKINKTEER